MNVLLDECIDRRFAQLLSGHNVKTVPQAGWAGIQNGDLMRRAENTFDVFITVDRNLSYQQDLSKVQIPVLVLRAVSNRFVDLEPFAEKVLEELSRATAGKAIIIELP